MLKKNRIKRSINEVKYCNIRLNTRSLKIVIRQANMYIGIPIPYRERRHYERQKGYLKGFCEYLSEYLSEWIDKMEQSAILQDKDYYSRKVDSMDGFFDLLKCYLDEKKGLKCFKSDLLKYWEKK